MTRRVLVLGAGGREHALAWRLARDPGVELVAAPGNDGIAALARCTPVDPADPAAVVGLARRERATLVVVGPEAPLAAGVADALAAAGIPVFGPGRAAAQLESSKTFAKQVLGAARVPTARARPCTSIAEVERALDELGAPYVVKADGLAAGKGVHVGTDRDRALAFARECVAGARFGAAGARVLVEAFLPGEEASVIAVCDGERFVLLPPARDYKRALDGDRGTNTGGMGAYAPAPVVDAAVERAVAERIVAPTLRELVQRGTPFRGALYCGLMIQDGAPRVVEFNARFGDPETQAIVPLVGGDFTALLEAAARGALDGAAAPREAGATVAVALVDDGYPDAPQAAGSIQGLDAIAAEDLLVFVAGAVRGRDAWRVRGGRAAYVVARAADHASARARAYDAVSALGGSGWRCRRDVAARVTGPGDPALRPRY